MTLSIEDLIGPIGQQQGINYCYLAENWKPLDGNLRYVGRIKTNIDEPMCI